MSGDNIEQNLEDYEEIETTIGDLKEDDLVYGTDGQWHSIRLIPITSKKMYNFITENGNIVCSYDHYWTLYQDGLKYELPTHVISQNFYLYKGSRVGIKNGPKLLSVEAASSEQFENNDNYQKCRCISVNSNDHQFEVITDKGMTEYTHNCQGRVVCGRVDTTASLMALGNTLGTAIDGSIKGRGIVSANGVMSNCQIYFDNPEWIDKWFLDRGLDPLGYPPEGLEEQEILLGDDEEEITIDNNLMEMDFEGIHKEINNAKRQEFDNV